MFIRATKINLIMENIFKGLDIYDAVEKARQLQGEWPKMPNKPYLKNNATPNEIREHADLLEKYEEDMESFRIIKSAYNNNVNSISEQLEYYIKEESGFFDVVPKQYQDKVWRLAWNEGHSSGYGEVYNYLIDLIEIFE